MPENEVGHEGRWLESEVGQEVACSYREGKGDRRSKHVVQGLKTLSTKFINT